MQIRYNVPDFLHTHDFGAVECDIVHIIHCSAIGDFLPLDEYVIVTEKPASESVLKQTVALATTKV